MFTFRLTNCLGPIKQGFGPKINVVEENHATFGIHLMTLRQKLRMLLEHEVVPKINVLKKYLKKIK